MEDNHSRAQTRSLPYVAPRLILPSEDATAPEGKTATSPGEGSAFGSAYGPS